MASSLGSGGGPAAGGGSSNVMRRSSSHGAAPSEVGNTLGLGLAGSIANFVTRSPRLDTIGSPYISSPRLGGASPRFGNRSPSPYNTPNPSTGFWSAFLGGSSSGGGAGLPGGGRRQLSRHAPTRLQLLRGVALRPLYVLSRRGPLFPFLTLLALMFLFITYSSNAHSQNVKRRVSNAVTPYIPQRAANALNWAPSSSAQHALLEETDELEDKTAAGQAALTKKKKRPGKHAVAKRALRPDGRIAIVEGEPHPIPELMRGAKKEWEVMKQRQSKTFAEAVKEYRRRYKRKPPKGFDKWYAFAKAHQVLMIDDFDLINNDLKKFRAFTPSVLQNRSATLEAMIPTHWRIEVKDGKASRKGPLGDHNRARGVIELLKRFVHELPDMTMIYNGEDNARIAIAAEELQRLEGLVDAGQHDADDYPYTPKERGPFPHHSMPVFCPPDSAVRAEGFDYGWPDPKSTGFEMPESIVGSSGSLINNFKAYLDPCNSPQYRHFHATTSWVYTHHPTPVLPFFSPGVQNRFGDIRALIIEQLELEAEHDPTWEERAFATLQWRGQTSGPLWESGTPWRTTHRARLHLLSHEESGSRRIAVTREDDIVRMVDVPNYRLNPLFLDTGMIGPAVQCVKEDGTCDKMYEVFQGYDKRISFDRASLYKYVLDVDGNSWSGRFRRLMQSNAAVVKATIFPEFWTDWCIPWLHFIPMQVDYSDMWDIMAFFRGGVNGEGAHDEMAKEIALAGKEWVRLCFRWADLEAYQYRLMLEYGRMWNEESTPGDNDFDGDTTVEPIWSGEVKLGR